MRVHSFSSAFPKNKVEIETFRNNFNDFDLAVARSGVKQKFVASPEQTALDLAIDAMIKVQNSDIVKQLDLIIFVTQTPDYLLPGNSFLLLKRLGLPNTIINYDLNQACSAFIYGTMLVEKFMVGGNVKKAALVCADTYSKILSDDDRGTSLLFGDAACVTFFDKTIGKYKVVGTKVENYSSFNDLFIVRAGSARDNYQSKSPTIEMQGMALLNLLQLVAPKFIRKFIAELHISLDDIDIFIFHQASRIALDTLRKSLGVPESKTFDNLENQGNTTCASIPLALNEMVSKYKDILPKKVLVFGFGVGFSIGCVLLELDETK